MLLRSLASSKGRNGLCKNLTYICIGQGWPETCHTPFSCTSPPTRWLAVPRHVPMESPGPAEARKAARMNSEHSREGLRWGGGSQGHTKGFLGISGAGGGLQQYPMTPAKPHPHKHTHREIKSFFLTYLSIAACEKMTACSQMESNPGLDFNQNFQRVIFYSCLIEMQPDA